MTKFLACHQHGFGFFGGIPSEILYDNMKNVVIKRLVGSVQWNKTFEAFCVHYGTASRAALCAVGQGQG
jgi:transposase